MCGRYIIKTRIAEIERRFNISVPEGVAYQANYNVGPGDMAPVITNNNVGELQMFRFGLQPFWAKKPMYFFNARSEGDRNKENDPLYKGTMGIVNKPAFRKPIRSQRCLVLADAFIEGTTKEKLSKPYVVYIRDNEEPPFAFAGIWDVWSDENSGETISSFAIITTVTNSLLNQIPHHRSPVILQGKEEEQQWLNSDTSMAEVTGLLRPFPGEKMNAYPISPDIKNPRNKSVEFVRPVGQRINKEFDFHFEKYLDLQGMGMTISRTRRKD